MQADVTGHVEFTGNGPDVIPVFSAEGALKNIAFGSVSGAPFQITP